MRDIAKVTKSDSYQVVSHIAEYLDSYLSQTHSPHGDDDHTQNNGSKDDDVYKPHIVPIAQRFVVETQINFDALDDDRLLTASTQQTVSRAMLFFHPAVRHALSLHSSGLISDLVALPICPVPHQPEKSLISLHNYSTWPPDSWISAHKSHRTTHNNDADTSAAAFTWNVDQSARIWIVSFILHATGILSAMLASAEESVFGLEKPPFLYILKSIKSENSHRPKKKPILKGNMPINTDFFRRDIWSPFFLSVNEYIRSLVDLKCHNDSPLTYHSSTDSTQLGSNKLLGSRDIHADFCNPSSQHRLPLAFCRAILSILRHRTDVIDRFNEKRSSLRTRDVERHLLRLLRLQLSMQWESAFFGEKRQPLSCGLDFYKNVLIIVREEARDLFPWFCTSGMPLNLRASHVPRSNSNLTTEASHPNHLLKRPALPDLNFHRSSQAKRQRTGNPDSDVQKGPSERTPLTVTTIRQRPSSKPTSPNENAVADGHGSNFQSRRDPMEKRLITDASAKAEESFEQVEWIALVKEELFTSEEHEAFPQEGATEINKAGAVEHPRPYVRAPGSGSIDNQENLEYYSLQKSKPVVSEERRSSGGIAVDTRPMSSTRPRINSHPVQTVEKAHDNTADGNAASGTDNNVNVENNQRYGQLRSIDNVDNIKDVEVYGQSRFESVNGEGQASEGQHGVSRTGEEDDEKAAVSELEMKLQRREEQVRLRELKVSKKELEVELKEIEARHQLAVTELVRVTTLVSTCDVTRRKIQTKLEKVNADVSSLESG